MLTIYYYNFAYKYETDINNSYFIKTFPMYRIKIPRL